MPEAVNDLDVAVIGMAGRFPGARNLREYWDNIRNGVESIRELSADELIAAGVSPDALVNADYVRACAVLDDADRFDSGFFGYSPREAKLLDPQSRVFLECAWEAFENAGYNPHRCGAVVGVYGAQSLSTYLLNQVGPELDFGQFTLCSGNVAGILANAGDFLPTRVSYKLRLTGPSVNVQTACSSSLVAVHTARQALLNGECDMALAGGVSIYFPQRRGYRHDEGNILSRDGHCRPFDAAASGTVFGRGAGVVLLKPLAAAIAAGDHIRAIIKGSAINNDGWGRAGFTAPGVDGQARVIAEALGNAGLTADSIGYVEAHGTGTAQGDPIEVAALSQAFRASTDRSRFCALGSVKANIGHLDTASGIAGFIKTVLALEHAILPPTVHFTKPNPQIDFANSPFYVDSAPRPWAASGVPRRAGVSSFGMGGTNAHVILEEAVPVATDEDPRPCHVLALSACSESALRALVCRYRDELDWTGEGHLADVCFTASVGRAHFQYRAALTIESPSEARTALDAMVTAANHASLGRGKASERPRRIAFLFTGQGAQYVGMARQLYETNAPFRSAFDRCDARLQRSLGRSITGVLYGEDAEAALLHETSFTQPALFAVEFALAEVWRSWGVRPQAVLGHSVGELSAACVAGVLRLDDALDLIAARGRLMQELPHRGAMAAVAAPVSAVEEVLEPLRAELGIAAINGPADTVISGTMAAVGEALRCFEGRGIRAKRLNVSQAFHSPLIDGMLGELERLGGRMSHAATDIELVSNLSGDVIAGSDLNGRYWREQARRPVRFWDGLETLRRRGYDTFIEIGPHPTLATIGERYSSGDGLLWLSSLRKGQSDWRSMLSALGRLYVAGGDIDWAAFHHDQPNRRVPLPTYPFEGGRHWLGSPDGLSSPEQRAQAKSPAPVRDNPPQETDWLYEVRWREVASSAATSQTPLPGTWLILADQGGVATRLAARLMARGFRAVVAFPAGTDQSGEALTLTLDPSDPGAFQRLWSEPSIGSWCGIVNLWGLDTGTPGTIVSCSDEQLRSCGSILYLVQAMAATRPVAYVPLYIVTRAAQSVDDADRVAVGQAPAWGLARTLRLELPELRIRQIDLDPSTPAEDGMLESELMTDGSEEQVAFRRGSRYAARLVPTRAGAPEPAAFAARSDATYLITGGLGSLGLRLAEWLASRGARYLVLTGRRPPSVKATAILDGLTQRGVNVISFQGDVASPADVAGMVAAASATRPLRGVIHAAGVLAAGAAVQLPWTRFADVLSPKVSGSWNLHEATRGLPLDFFVMFSSASSLLGAIGHSSYAAANAFLDALAHDRRAQQLPALSVNWGPWATEGMAAAWTDHDLRRGAGSGVGTGLITPELGLRALESLLTHPAPPQAAVLQMDWPRFVAEFGESGGFLSDVYGARQAGRRTNDTRGGEQAPLPALMASVAPARRIAALTDAVREIVITVLELDAANGPEPLQGLRDLGLDSLLALDLKNRLQTATGRRLSPTLAFDYPTIADLAAYLATDVFGIPLPEAPTRVAQSSPENRDVAALGAMSEEEAEALLIAELSMNSGGERHE